MKIEKKDLKLGDWVSLNDRNAQVTEMLLNNVSLSNGESGTYDELCTIRLTTDIITNNGWKLKREVTDEDLFEYCIYEYEKNNALTMQYYPRDGKLFSIFWCDSEIFPDIKYVYQLQHVLWILGINDEIKLQKDRGEESYERKIIDIFKLLDSYNNTEEGMIEEYESYIPNFNDTFFLLYGNPYAEVFRFKTKSDAMKFINSSDGNKLLSKYGQYLLSYGEKYLIYEYL